MVEEKGPTEATLVDGSAVEKHDAVVVPAVGSSDTRLTGDYDGMSTVVTDFVVHLVCLVVYLVPLWIVYHDSEMSYTAILDENFITDNGDVTGGHGNTLRKVFENDYWGRSMYNPSSHKSWRPVSILSFRFLLSEHTSPDHVIFWHRLVNLIVHAAVADMVSNCACHLYGSGSSGGGAVVQKTRMVRRLSKLLFALHPTHVEAVSNAANRPHILSLLFTLLAVDDRTSIFVLPITMTLALMTSETATFQLPAVLVTLTVIQWKQRQQQQQRTRQQQQQPHTTLPLSDLCDTVFKLLPRYFAIAAPVFSYLYLRHAYDTLDIPHALIRPAENPFYRFTGLQRTLSYSLVLAVHVGKLFLLDPLGFAHEYGYACLPAVDVVDGAVADLRLLAPLLLGVTLVVTILYTTTRRGLESTLMLTVALSWVATLFPISGVVKVGTFIADRILVPSTVAFAVFGAIFLTNWICRGKDHGTIQWLLPI